MFIKITYFLKCRLCLTSLVDSLLQKKRIMGDPAGAKHRRGSQLTGKLTPGTEINWSI
jgi:hypothetical protein